MMLEWVVVQVDVFVDVIVWVICELVVCVFYVIVSSGYCVMFLQEEIDMWCMIFMFNVLFGNIECEGGLYQKKMCWFIINWLEKRLC